MAERTLNLKLKYKDKYLDTAKFKRDFTKKFYIGSDRHQFWQILDKKFPGKYLLISRKGDGFNLYLRNDMDLNVRKDGEDLTKNELRQKNLLKGNVLKLDINSNGQITFADDWQIEYFFLKPYQYVPASEEMAIIKEFSKWPPLSREQRFTRNFLLLGLLFTVIGILVVDSLYVPPPKMDFLQRLERIDQIATRIEPEIIEELPSDVPINIAEEKAETEEEAQEVMETAEKTSVAEFEEMFGEVYESSGDFQGELFEIDVVSEIVVNQPVSGVKTPVKRDQGNRTGVLEQVSSKSIDVSSINQDFQSLESLDLGSEFKLEEVDLASLSGEVEEFQTTKVKSKAQFEVVKRKFQNLQTVQESSIELQEFSPEAKTEIANINQVVNAYKPQITKIFIVEQMYMDMYGTIEFVLYIDDNGKVVAVDINPVSGSFFTDSFIQKTEDTIMKWKIPVTKAVPYSFRMKFLKQ
ncbi:MAG: hypothetical protein JW996_04500 [Candidatus Cloacimonetes bacterium]|nr:hypothetical protein [Candidatus Cloacimonadota bacterium]